ncbi:MAG TPA: DUF5916 domain-containing protein, partial [Myxococcaceae bacterium]|nr:DUF5916 domain-containing protein [Myxococcaceae bacterium]
MCFFAPMRPLLAPLVLASVLLVSLVARARGLEGERPRVRAVRVEQGPRVDGVLDDAVWQRATFLTGLVQKEPEQGRPATLRTEVAFLHDADALYVGARMEGDGAEEAATVMTRRDESGVAERLIISLDTYRDRRTAYSFAVTAAGVRVDWYHPDDDEYRRELSFNPVWEARTSRTPEGWVAELRIPFSQLRFNEAEEQVWGLNVNRYIPRRNEDVFWVVVPRDVTAWSSRFGELTGLRGVAPSRRLELLPYLAADLRTHSGEDPRAGTPFAGRRPYGGRVGLDAKMGLGPDLTLAATFNPDFGQVEADPAQVNLSAFEPFLEERRPFFTEGSQLFQGPLGPSYFYSRRVGGAPRLSADADFVEVPPASTLWGATRLTGRLSSGLSLGVLGAVTGEVYADTYDDDSREQGRQKLEPYTHQGVVRVQQELGPSGSVVGATFTSLYRHLGEGEGRTRELAREAYTGGADFRLRLRGGEYLLSGFAGGSVVRGSPEALVRLQRSSAHFFQRPDQDYVRVDPEATSLSGYTAGAQVERLSGSWLWNAGLSLESPGFELNELGRLESADDIDLSLGLRYRDTEPGRVLRGWDLGLGASSNWNYGGVRQSSGLTLSGSATLRNFWSSDFRVTYQPRSLSDTLTRGGPLMQTGQGVDGELYLRGNQAGPYRWTVGGGAWRSETGSRGGYLWGSLTLQPTRWLRLGVEPTASRYTEGVQYVDTREGGREETYGQRHVLASVRRRELALRLRANLFLSPDLSLEAYAEPFASSGHYPGVGELARAGGRALRRYGEDGTSLVRRADGSVEVRDGTSSFLLENPDFNLRSFRSNVVLRWEWSPGSTLFLVWQQRR